MRRKSNPQEAERLLARVPDQVSFWLCTNQKLFSLRELSAALETISDETFRYHVNRDKNDFENWIRDIIQDRELAREISRIKTRETLTRKITDRVSALSRFTKKSQPKKVVKKASKKKVKKKIGKKKKKR